MIKPIEIKNFLSHEECDILIELSNNLDFKQAKTVYGDEIIENLNFNKREISYIESKNFNDVFKNLSDSILEKIKSLNIFKGLKYDNIVVFYFNKYAENDYIDYHNDGNEIKYGATITIVLELSNNYEGGEFYYTYNDEELKFEKGKGYLYIFDSNMWHKVNPITSGIRFSINCWPKYSITKTLT